MAPDGERFVLLALNAFIDFIRDGKVYRQPSAGFIDEVTTYPFYAAGVNAAWLAAVAELEMRVLMGIIAGSSTTGFVIIVGLEVSAFVAENSKDFRKWYYIFLTSGSGSGHSEDRCADALR